MKRNGACCVAIFVLKNGVVYRDWSARITDATDRTFTLHSRYGIPAPLIDRIEIEMIEQREARIFISAFPKQMDKVCDKKDEKKVIDVVYDCEAASEGLMKHYNIHKPKQTGGSSKERVS